MPVKEVSNKKSAPLEKDVQKKIVEYLKNNGFSVDVITKGLYGSNGIADIIACKHGRYFAFEVKRRPGMKTSPLQAAWLDEKHKHGAIAKCVGSVEEVAEIVNWFDKGGNR